MFEFFYLKKFSLNMNKSLEESNTSISTVIKDFSGTIVSHNGEKIKFQTMYTFNNFDPFSGVDGLVYLHKMGKYTKIDISLNFKRMIIKNILYAIIPMLILSILIFQFFFQLFFAIALSFTIAFIFLFLNLLLLPLILYQKSRKIHFKLTERLRKECGNTIILP